MAAENGMLSRRGLLRSAGVGAIGLAGAAMLGCQTAAPTSTTEAPAGGASVATRGVDILPLTAPVAQGKPRAGGTYVTSVGATTWVEHDSHTQRGASEWHVISDKLTESNPTDAKVLPMIATSWEVGDKEGLTLVFKLKPGIKMHNMAPWNGREFDATDVAWNLERIGGLYADRLKLPAAAFQRATMVQNITKAEAIDKHTVKVTLSAPNSGLFAGVSENRTVLMPKEMDDIGFRDPLKFGGMGPYQITEFKKDQAINFKKFDGYHRTGEPSFTDFWLQVIPDRAANLAAFVTNQVQLWSGLNETEADTIKKSKPESLLYTWIDCNWNHIRPSVTYQPFQDFRVRNAIHLALDYQEIGNGIYGSGWGYQAAMSPGFVEAWKPDKVKALPGYNPATKAADRAEAQKLLAAAGFPAGKGIELDNLYTATSDNHKDAATRFQAQMATVFPEMKVVHRPVDTGTFSTQQTAGTFKTLSYVITSAPDPVLESISQYHTQGSRNYGKFSDKNLDALLEKSLRELNFDARKQLLEEYQTRWVNEWRPNYTLHANAVRNVLQPNIGGYDKLAGTWYGYSTWTKVSRLTYLDK